MNALNIKPEDILKRTVAFFDWVRQFYSATGGMWFVITLLLLLFLQLPPLYVLLICLLLFLTFLTWVFYAYSKRKERLYLRRKWQALAWTHYRQVLAEALVRSCSEDMQIKFDFVTFYNGNFERLLNGGFYSELQYTRGSKHELDLVIFDIEYLDDLTDGVQFDEADYPFKLVPFDRFLEEKEIGQFPAMPDQFKNVLRPKYDLTWALPLRWGFTGVAAKLTPGCRLRLKSRGFDLDSCTQFDLDWLTDTGSEFYRWLQDPNEPCWVVSLDWYLPTMMLVACDVIGAGCHELTDAQLQRVLERMKNLTPLMHPTEPLVEDPLRLAQRVHGQENLIIVGGGNWLQLLGQMTPTDLKLFPMTRGYLLWCECLGFLAPDGKTVDMDWQRDAQNLAKWFLRKQHDIMRASSFHAYTPSDRDAYQKLSKGGVKLLVRQLPPPDGGPFASRLKWEQAWKEWRSQLQSRSA